MSTKDINRDFPMCPKCNGHGYILYGSDKIGCTYCHSEGVTVNQLKEIVLYLRIRVWELEEMLCTAHGKLDLLEDDYKELKEVWMLTRGKRRPERSIPLNANAVPDTDDRERNEWMNAPTGKPEDKP